MMIKISSLLLVYSAGKQYINLKMTTKKHSLNWLCFLVIVLSFLQINNTIETFLSL